LNYEDFVKVFREIAPASLQGVDLLSIYNSMTKANLNKKFYLIDFFILLISIGKFTLKQKLGLLFDLVAGFYKTFDQDQPGNTKPYLIYNFNRYNSCLCHERCS